MLQLLRVSYFEIYISFKILNILIIASWLLLKSSIMWETLFSMVFQFHTLLKYTILYFILIGKLIPISGVPSSFPETNLEEGGRY